MSETEARTELYYHLLTYFERIDPAQHFRGVFTKSGHWLDWWPEVVQAIEAGEVAI